jgi:hypothetical protein
MRGDDADQSQWAAIYKKRRPVRGGVLKVLHLRKNPLVLHLHFEGVLHANALILLHGTNSAGIANKIRGFCEFCGPVSCRTVSQLFPSCFNELQRVAVTPCDMNATCGQKTGRREPAPHLLIFRKDRRSLLPECIGQILIF